MLPARTAMEKCDPESNLPGVHQSLRVRPRRWPFLSNAVRAPARVEGNVAHKQIELSVAHE